MLYKGSKVPGLILVGGADTILKGVFIKKVVPDFPASKDGRLQPGDQILNINNSPMEGATHNDALHALQQSSAYIHLMVRREPGRQQAPIIEEGECRRFAVRTFLPLIPALVFSFHCVSLLLSLSFIVVDSILLPFPSLVPSPPNSLVLFYSLPLFVLSSFSSFLFSFSSFLFSFPPFYSPFLPLFPSLLPHFLPIPRLPCPSTSLPSQLWEWSSRRRDRNSGTGQAGNGRSWPHDMRA